MDSSADLASTLTGKMPHVLYYLSVLICVARIALLDVVSFNWVGT